tara:strand:+ start:2128 stop:2625 length:498 start_codon:yes stop_codon:yes gene_type:complete
VSDVLISPLSDCHNRAKFNCGVDFIDKWCRKKCLEEHNKRYSRVFVATCGDDDVIGLYSLSIRPLHVSKGIRYHVSDVPAVYFDNLGVTKNSRGNNIGAALMVDAFERTLSISENAGIHCLWLTAIDEPICEFYTRLGFTRTKPRGRKSTDMFIPRQEIEDSLSG